MGQQVVWVILAFLPTVNGLQVLVPASEYRSFTQYAHCMREADLKAKKLDDPDVDVRCMPFWVVRDK